MAFSTESISQPHEMSGASSADRFVVSPAKTEQWIMGRCRDEGRGGKERVRGWVRRLRRGEEDGRRVDCRKFEAFAIGEEKVRREKTSGCVCG